MKKKHYRKRHVHQHASYTALRQRHIPYIAKKKYSCTTQTSTTHPNNKQESSLISQEPSVVSSKKTNIFSSIRKKQSNLHSKDIKIKQETLNLASTKKENIQSSIQEEVKQLKELKKTLKAQKKELKLTKKEIHKSRKKNYGLISMILIGLLITFSIFLFFVVKWLFKTWPHLQISELMYQAKIGVNGTSKDMITAFVLQTVVPTGFLLVAVILFFIILAYSGKQLRRFGKSVLVIISIILLTISCVTFNNKIGFVDYINNLKNSSDFIQLHYVDPSITEITFPEKKRNLITIYLESMEVTYADKESGGGMDVNYIPELTTLANENENFSGDRTTLNGGISLPNTTWTMGGLFASTSGLPLQLPTNGNNMDTQVSFFANTTVLGDILFNNGYRNYFACGSDGTFGGRGLYFTTHGNYEIHDINYNKNMGRLDSDYYVWWGFEDSKLIDYAKEDLSTIAYSDEPFNYTLLTVDTHFEDGYVCEDCENLYDGNRYGNVIRCSSKKITEFITWIQEQPWYENTTLVLTGDHPTMDSDFCNDVDSNYQRKVYVNYINAAPVENNSTGYREYSTCDTFPTIIAALGATIEGNRLGLGTNLYSGLPTYHEEYGKDTMYIEIRKQSEFMEELADINYSALRDRDGFHSSCTTTLDSYHDGIATITVKDIFGYEEDNLDQVRIRITESSGNVAEQIMTNMGDGIYEASLPLLDDNIDYVHVEVIVTSSSSDLSNTVEETFIDYYGNLYLISSTQLNITNYLKGLLHLDLNRYTIFMTTQGDASSNLSKKQIELLTELGAGSLVFGKGDTGYGILSETNSYIKNGYGYIREDGYIPDTDIPYVLSSSNNAEDPSSIQIGWDFEEYCPQQNGINFVIWDTATQSVINQASFNTGTYGPNGKLTTQKPGFLDKQETITLSNLSGVADGYSIVGIIYDDTDSTYKKQSIMTYDDETDTYTLDITGSKDELKNKSVRVYARYTDFTYRYIGSVHLQ